MKSLPTLPLISLLFHLAIFIFCVHVQDREIMRVLVECCLQEQAFNKYYTTLASMLCERDKNHKFTLQVLISVLELERSKKMACTKNI